jgi:hypothetical protein
VAPVCVVGGAGLAEIGQGGEGRGGGRGEGAVCGECVCVEGHSQCLLCASQGPPSVKGFTNTEWKAVWKGKGWLEVCWARGYRGRAKGRLGGKGPAEIGRTKGKAKRGTKSV